MVAITPHGPWLQKTGLTISQRGIGVEEYCFSMLQQLF